MPPAVKRVTVPRWASGPQVFIGLMKEKQRCDVSLGS